MSDKKKDERRSSGKKEKKSSTPQESPRSSAWANDGRDLAQKISLPVSIPISLDAGGEIVVVDPRRRDSVNAGRADSVTEPVDWEERMAFMVQSALARAPPAALGAPAHEPGPPASTSSKHTAPLALQPRLGTTSTDVPTTQNDVHTLAPLARQSGQGGPSSDVHTRAPLARQSGQGDPSSDVHTRAPLARQSGQGDPSSDVHTRAPLARQSGQGGPSSDVPNPMSTLTRPAQDSAVGVPSRAEGAVPPRGRSPLPLAGSPQAGRSRRRDRADHYNRYDRYDSRYDRRTVTLGRSRTPATLNTSTVTSSHRDRAPVPAVGHALPTTETSAAEARPPPQMTLPPPPTRLIGDRDEERMIEFSINESLSEDERQEPHPFAEVPGLKDCPMAGLKSALTRQHSAEAPTDRQTALWTQSRGGTEVRAVKTYKIDSIYTGPEGPGTSSFSPLDLPEDLLLSVQQWQTDNALKKQQRLLGSTARALLKGLERMERPLACVQELADKIESDDVKGQLYDAVELMQTDAVVPLGHALRYLASGFNEITFKRRELAANAIRDKSLQQQVKAATLGFESFFKEDLSHTLATAASRQQQQALTSALRHRGSSYSRPSEDRQRDRHERPRSRSPARRDRARHRPRSSRPFRRSPSWGGSSRGWQGGGRRSPAWDNTWRPGGE